MVSLRSIFLFRPRKNLIKSVLSATWFPNKIRILLDVGIPEQLCYGALAVSRDDNEIYEK